MGLSIKVLLGNPLEVIAVRFFSPEAQNESVSAQNTNIMQNMK